MDTSRHAGNESAAKDQQQLDNTQKGAGGGGAYQKAIVIEVLSNPEEFDFLPLIDVEDGAEPVLAPETDWENLPDNSLLVRLGDTKSGVMQVAYPFFPSHLQFPCKPGEKVWTIQDGNKVYWMARVPGNKVVEDANYSHLDREIFAQSSPVDTKEKAEQAEGTTDLWVPWSNDNDDGTTRSLDYDEKDPNSKLETYQILKEASLTQNYRVEAVPRFHKRPGDTVIQGSNNTLICLGEDRGWTRANTDDEIFSPDGSIFTNANELPEYRSDIGFCGSIDIVAGRANESITVAAAAPTTTSGAGDDPVRTDARVIENREGFVETDKNPTRNQIVQHHTEGDPDFWRDTSRIYVSMSTDVDANFMTGVQPGDDVNYGAATVFDGEQADTTGSPPAGAIAIKSDHVRIIARRDDDSLKNGSVLIIKEGDPTADEDHCSILLAPDGGVHISAQKIYLGRSSADAGIGGGPGPDGAQPYVKYQELEDLFNAFMDDIKTFCDSMTAAPTPGYGAPSPAIDAAVAALKAAMDSRKGEIANIQSERIFGE